MRYHFVYETINKLNGKFYRGKHSTSQLEDKYLGSGKALHNAIKKYGKENFEREILTFCVSEDDAYLSEEELVAAVLGDPMCYNIMNGGRGFSSESARAASLIAQELHHCQFNSESGKAASIKSQENGWYGFRSMDKDKFLEIASKGGTAGAAKCKELNLGMFSWTTEERSKWASERSKDTHWITNGIIECQVKTDKVIPDGFVKGRNITGWTGRIGMSCWTDGKIHVFSFESPGPEFYNGMIKETPTAKLPWWNNGTINKRSVDCPGKEFVRGKFYRPDKIVACPHCPKVGGICAMKQHHFKNCKFNPNRS